MAAREIRAEGGEATLCRARLIDGIRDAHVQALFRAARDADYAEVERRVNRRRSRAGAVATRLDQVRKVDFFESAGRERAERAVAPAEDETQWRRDRCPAGPSG